MEVIGFMLLPKQGKPHIAATRDLKCRDRTQEEYFQFELFSSTCMVNSKELNVFAGKDPEGKSGWQNGYPVKEERLTQRGMDEGCM